MLLLQIKYHLFLPIYRKQSKILSASIIILLEAFLIMMTFNNDKLFYYKEDLSFF